MVPSVHSVLFATKTNISEPRDKIRHVLICLQYQSMKCLAFLLEDGFKLSWTGDMFTALIESISKVELKSHGILVQLIDKVFTSECF